MRTTNRVLTVAGGALTLMLMSAAPGFAHDCFNPQKDAHAPTGGVNYTLSGFNQNGPILTQTGPGKGQGGFVAIAPGTFGNPTTIYTHGHKFIESPGSLDPERACDGKGLDYHDACAP